MRKKLLAVLLCILMILTLIPSIALADGETPPEAADPEEVVTPSDSAKGGNGEKAPSDEASDDPSDEDTSTLEVTLPTLRSGETVLDISRSSITIGDGTITGVDDGGNPVTTANPNGYVITGTSDSNTVTVTGGTHDITLQNLSIDASVPGSPAFDISTGATVNLTLDGTNTLTGGDSMFGGCAGLQVPDGATVNITGQSNGSGSLTATGGSGGAGIGGGSNADGGTVNISGGNVIATGTDGGAGIGGGNFGAGGTVTISGGNVTATGADGGAGIGGGYGTTGDGGSVTISGGNVTATGGNDGAGIGGGYSAGGGTVNISGGNVIATGTVGGAGIGGGREASGGAVIISGGNVKAIGQNGASDIGKGAGSATLTDGTLTKDGTVAVSLTTITLDGAAAATPISDPGTNGYGVNDVTTLDTNKLYFYLPTAATVNGVITDTSPEQLYMESSPIAAGGTGTLRLAGAAIADVTVTGTKDAALTSQDATITLTTETFNALAADTDVSAWFTNIPTGLVAKIKTAVAANATSAVVTFSGTPTVESSAVMTVVLPKADLSSGLADITVTANNNAKWGVSAPAVGINFTAQPASATVTEGSITGNLTAAATMTPSGTPTLDWYACDSAGTVTGSSLASGGTFTIPTTLTAGTYYYVCRASSTGVTSVDSNVAAVTVSAPVTPSITFTTQPTSTLVTAGSITGNLTAAATVTPSGTPTLNWYVCDANGVPSGTSLGTGGTLPIPTTLAVGTYYYLCQATYSGATAVNSVVAKVTVNSTTAAPITGDDSQLVLWFCAALLSGLGLPACLIVRRRHSNG